MSKTPETTRISLTAKQLASLDLLIAKKRAGASLDDVANEVANNLGNVAANATVGAIAAGAAGATPVAAVLATAGAVAAATAVATQAAGVTTVEYKEAIRAIFHEAARQMPLDKLVELRNMAIVKN